MRTNLPAWQILQKRGGFPRKKPGARDSRSDRLSVVVLSILALLMRPTSCQCNWWSTGQISDQTYTSHNSNSLTINVPDATTSSYYSYCYTGASLCYTDTATNGNGCVDITSNYNSVFPWITGFDTTYGTLTIQKSDLRYLVTSQTQEFTISMLAWRGSQTSYFYDGGSCNGDYFSMVANSDGSATTWTYSQSSYYGWHDRVASVWLPTGYTAQLWMHDCYQGDQLTMYGNGSCQYVGGSLTDNMSCMYLWGLPVGSSNSFASYSWTFDVTVRNRCMDNALTATGNPSNIDYLIDDDGSTPTQTQYGTVTGSISSAYCPLTRVMQIWDDTEGDWVNFSSSTYPWGSYTDQSSSNRMKFSVQTESGTTLDSASIENTVYHVRVKTYDPYSTQSSSTIYQAFDVTFNYECQDDYFTLSGMGELYFALGSADYTINIGVTQAKTNCARTVSHYYYNNSTSEWESFSGANFRRSEGFNYIGIGVTASSYSQYMPDVYHRIKIVWTSTYSERSDGVAEEEFKLHFYHPCYQNALSLSSQLSDYTHQVDETSISTFTPSVSTTVSTSTCPLTATCEIYDDGTDSWDSCNTSPFSIFYYSFSTSSGQYKIRYKTSVWNSNYPSTSPYERLVYQVRISLNDPNSISDQNSVSDTFTITIQNTCALDTITQSSSDTDIGTSTIYIGGSNLYRKIDFTQSQSGCNLLYGLQWRDDNTDTWEEYVNTATTPWVQSFSTSNGNLYLIAANDANFASYKPFREIDLKLTVTSTSSIQESNLVEDWFTLRIEDQCYSNTLSVSSSPADVAYLIDDDGSTAANTQYATVTGSWSESRCPLTRTVEIWDDTSGDFIAFNTGVHTWAAVTDQSSSYSRIRFTVDTEAGTTLDSQYVDETLYHMRVVTKDNAAQESSSNPTYQTFDVSFNYECQSDYFTLSGVSEQQFQLGQSDKTISFGMTQAQTYCHDTYVIYYYNNNTSEWDSNIASLNFYRSQTDNSLTIGVNSGSHSLYEPEVWYRIKVVWTSTYSEQVAGTATEEFKIQFYDACVDNYLTLNSELSDAIFQVNNGGYTSYTPSFSTSVSTSVCPLVSTCEIYSESQDKWINCNNSPSGPYTTKDQKASRFFNWFDTGNTGEYRVQYSISNYQNDYSSPYPDVEYQVRIRVEDPQSIHASNFIEDTFTLTIQFKCALDTITHVQSQSDLAHTQLTIDYTTGTLRQLGSSYFTQLYSECPLTYTLKFWNKNSLDWDLYTDSPSSYPFVESWNVATTYYSTYAETRGTGQLYLGAIGLQSYDDYPWYNITAAISVKSDYSVQSEASTEYEDQFVISIVERCRMVRRNAKMVLGSGGLGVFGNPYPIDMWQRLDIPVTTTTYISPYTDPHSYTRCTVTHTLHYNDEQLTPVDTQKYTFYNSAYSTQLSIQWNYGTFDDFFVVVVKVAYDSGGKNVEVVKDVGIVYVKVSNPCLVTAGGAITPKTINDIQYWIKDSLSSTSVTYFADYPTTRDGNQSYLYANGNNLCGTKSYEIVMADKTANTDTAFLNLANSGNPMYINVHTTNPVYYTNSYVTYYLKVTLDSYVDDYGDDEAVYYEPFRLDMKNCQVTSFNKDADMTQNYILYTPVLKLPYTAWTDNAQAGYIRTGSRCMDNGYVLDYSVKWRNFYDTTLTVPTMVNWKWPSDGLHEFWIYSDDTVMVEYDRQEFVIELTASTNILDMDPIYSETWTLTITVQNLCPGDTLSLSTSYPHNFVDYTYYIGENTDTPSFVYSSIKPKDHTLFNANWDTSVPYCPLDFEILRDYTATGTPSRYEAFTQNEQLVVSLINPMEITVPGRDWTNSVASHQLTWQEQFVTGPYYYDLPQITLKIQTSDYSLLLDDDGVTYLDEVVWWLAVNRVSTKSDVDNSASRIYFKLTLADVCHDVPITASEPLTGGGAATLDVYLFDYFTISHQNYQITNGYGWPSVQTYCGEGFTHYLMYESLVQGIRPRGVEDQPRGAAYVANNVETIFGIETNGNSFDASGTGVLLTNLHWVGDRNIDVLGQHQFYIRTYIGKLGGDRRTSGDGQGMYSSHFIDSTYSLTLNVKNPCNEAQLTIPTLTKNVDGTQIHVLEAREHGGQYVLQYEMPWSDVSQLYGPNMGVDQYSLCGPLRHYMTMDDGSVHLGLQSASSNFRSAKWLEFEYFPDGDPTDPFNNYPPVYQIRVNSTSKEDWGAHMFTLHFEYVNYPMSTIKSEAWLVNAQIEYCLVKTWKAPADFQVVFTVGQKPISVEYVFQQFPCTYGATYSIRLVEISGVVQTDEATPAFINADTRSGFMSVYTDDLGDLGWYVLEVTATLDVLDNLGDLDELNNLPAEDYPDDPDNIFLNSALYDTDITINTGLASPSTVYKKVYGKEGPPEDFIYQTAFNITLGVIQVNESSITENNTAPYLLPKPVTTHRVIIGQAWELNLGQAFDWEGNGITINMNLKNAAQFFRFDVNTMTLSVPAGVTDKETQPVFDMKLTLTDDDPYDPKSRSYDFTIVMVKDYKDPVYAAIQDARKQEVLYTYPDRVYDLTQTTVDEVMQASGNDIVVPKYSLGLAQVDLEELKKQEQLDEKINPKPAPVVESLSSDGRVVLRFNTPMQVPNLDELAASKVALRLTKAVSENEVSTKEYLTENGIGEFQIRNAVEVNMKPSSATDNSEKIEFSWQILSFTEYKVEIQLYFEFPESVSAASNEPDNVEITFWAGDLFSAQNGKQMRSGLTITAPVTRQVSIDDAKVYKDYGRWVGYSTLGLLIAGFLLAMPLNADTLPVWACYDSLVLISHLPLLNTAMPGRASIFLAEIANILRFNFEFIGDWYREVDVGHGDRPLTNLFMQNGYSATSIVINLFMVLVFLAVLILGVGFAKIGDCTYVTSLKQPRLNGRTEVRVLSSSQKASNMLFRLILAAFLEIFICVLINFKAETKGNETDFEDISRIVSIFMLVLCTLVTMLIFIITAFESSPDIDPKEPHIAHLETMYLDMKIQRKTASNTYILAYLLRRAVYALVVIMMNEYPALQIMVLFVTSGIVTAILLRSKPYLPGLPHWTVVAYEIIFAWTCILCMMFSPEYMYRSYEIATDMANAICIITTLVSASGVLLLGYSLLWQASFNKRRIENMQRAAELARMQRLRRHMVDSKQLAPITEAVHEEEPEEQYIVDNRSKRQRQKMRKMKDIVRMNNEASVPEKTNLEDDNFMLEDDDGFEADNLLEQMVSRPEKVLEAGNNSLLLISDDELPTDRKQEAQQQQEAVGTPKSIGAESSYSDFMQQWKNKLMKDEEGEEGEGANGPTDVVSNYSRHSNNPADNSPFRDISSKQTSKLLRGQKTEIIAEQQREESGDSEDDGAGAILSKVERRRLNMLNERQSSNNTITKIGAISPSDIVEDAAKQEQNQEEDEDFELM